MRLQLWVHRAASRSLLKLYTGCSCFPKCTPIETKPENSPLTLEKYPKNLNCNNLRNKIKVCLISFWKECWTTKHLNTRNLWNNSDNNSQHGRLDHFCICWFLNSRSFSLTHPMMSLLTKFLICSQFYFKISYKKFKTKLMKLKIKLNKLNLKSLKRRLK